MSGKEMIYLPIGKSAGKAALRARRICAEARLGFPRLVLPADELASERDQIFRLISELQKATLPEDQRDIAIRVLKFLDEAFVIVKHMVEQGEKFDRESTRTRLKEQGIK
jgi:hypothetical protein